jgi:small subunit ribosomal protein S9
MALQIKKSVPMKVNKKPVVSATQHTAKAEYIVSIGRRKSATARVRLYRGKGQSMVNNKPVTEYFKSVDPMGVAFNRAFGVVAATGMYVTAKVSGSGLHSQVDAIVHGIAHALVKVDASYKDTLRKAGLLTRDARIRESRKMGTGGKARRAKQSPKR